MPLPNYGLSCVISINMKRISFIICLCSIFFIQAELAEENARKIYIIGDSTVASYSDSDYPMTGWGQVLQLYLDESKIEVNNKAIGGRSSRGFWEEGRWDGIRDQLNTGDFVFIQFGHNDRDWTREERYTDTAAYKDYLRIYVTESREKGAIPVLVSPMVMNAWSGANLRNVFTEGKNDYRGAMLEVAGELDVHFVDLNIKSHQRVAELGQEYATYFIYMGLEAGEYPNYPEGRADGTHFQEMGALEMARLLIEGISELAQEPEMAVLVEALLPYLSLSTSISSKDAGLVTVSGEYPRGAPLSLKTRLFEQYAFGFWEDELNTRLSDSRHLEFALDSSMAIRAVVSDCSGDIGGEAIVDDCGLCTGGQTGYEPCQQILKCVDACDFSGNKLYSTIGGVTKKIVNTSNAEESPYLIQGIAAENAGSYDLALIYHSVISGEKLSILVNGQETHIGLDLIQSGGWEALYFSTELESGANMLHLQSSADQGGILFDIFAARSQELSTGPCNTSMEENLSDKQMGQIYPNPFSNYFEVKLSGPFTYRVFNTFGSLVFDGEGMDRAKVGQKLDSGIYIIQFIQESKISNHIIQKL